MNEADTCRIYITPKLQAAGWDNPPHSLTQEKTFTAGRVMLTTAGNVTRKPQKRADYLLRYTRDFTIAVVEAKARDEAAGKGMQQAKEYASILGLKFAYATNGLGILEFDYITGLEKELSAFPTPAELWSRLMAAEHLSDATAEHLLTPFYRTVGETPRYYQEIAINRIVQAILQGRRRLLVTLATGTGKTKVAFQVCWKLWNGRWNRSGGYQRPRILFLADRNVLVDDPKDKEFAPFGDARHKLEGGEIIKGKELYFALYQSLAQDQQAPLYRRYAPDFFDLIIVDECHRGSAREDSYWREILSYFAPAYQLGMTATPLRQDNRDTYAYFGNPLYTYSLRQGIEDGFLAPYRVHRVVIDVDATGWRPDLGEKDRYGRAIPDREYHTEDFERILALRARTEAIARHLTAFMKRTDRLAKTIVFCVDQDHADEMRRALNNLNQDLVKRYPHYAVRVTAEEGLNGRAHLSRFQELDSIEPVILTTSQLLTTGVNAPTCKNIVLARVVNSISEFKQIIGRGTRLREDYGKLFFNILDYTGSATRQFADPDFDGFPEVDETIQIDADGNVIGQRVDYPGVDYRTDTGQDDATEADSGAEVANGGGEPPPEPRKFFVDSGEFKVVAHLVYELDADGSQLNVVQYTDYTAAGVRTLFKSADELRDHWADPLQRNEVIAELIERGIDFKLLAEATGRADADPFDLLCHLAFAVPLRSRRERVERLQRQQEFWERYSPEARAILDALLDKYTAFGPEEFNIPDALKLPPIAGHGNVEEIALLFGGPERLRQAVAQTQALLYAV